MDDHVESTTTDLNGHSGFILAVFCVVSLLVIWPVHIPVPRRLERWLLLLLIRTRIINKRESDVLAERGVYFSLSLKTAPVIGVVLLLASTTIHGSTIQLGIKGDETIRPYDVLVLFISLVCTQTDCVCETLLLLPTGLYLHRP